MLFLLNVSQIKRQHCQNPPYRNNINMHTRLTVSPGVNLGSPTFPEIPNWTIVAIFFSYIKLSLLVRMLYFVGNKTFSKIVMNDLFLWLSVLHRTFPPPFPKKWRRKERKETSFVCTQQRLTDVPVAMAAPATGHTHPPVCCYHGYALTSEAKGLKDWGGGGRGSKEGEFLTIHHSS